MSARDRLAVPALAVAPGSVLVLPMIGPRADEKRAVEPYRLRAVSDQASDLMQVWRDLPLILLGLLLVWRGRDRIAWGVAMLLLGIACLFPLLYHPAPASISGVTRLFVEYLVRPVVALSVMIAMLGMLGDSTPRLARAMVMTWTAFFVVSFVERLAIDVPWIASGIVIWGRPTWVSLSFTFGSMLLFAVYAVLVYRRTDIAMRLRARWVLLGVVLYIVSVLDIMTFRHDLLWVVPYMLSMLVFAYAVLRHKLVSTSFAISRTVVYGAVAALIVGVFAVVEHAIAAMAMGKNAGLALHLGVPLVLGILVHRIHGKVEQLVERVFFRQRFLAEQRLDRLASESAFMTRPAALVARLLQEVASALQVTRVALYWRSDAHGGYCRRGQFGIPQWPRHVDADDPVFVKLRAGESSTQLAGQRGSLGSGGIAFAMSVAGRVQGAVLCGERASQYAPDERQQMVRVAHDVGVALHALGSQASEKRLAQLLEGRLSIEVLRREGRLAQPE